MSDLSTQIRELSPSAKEPLFRRLMVIENLAYLREKNSIIGFEVDTEVNQTLSGFALISIQKHTIYAYCSDRDEKPRLILFPPIEKLFDPAFELLGLQVTKRRFTDSKFIGAKLGSGTLEDLVRDLTPPEKEVDIPSSIMEQMADHIKKIESGSYVNAATDMREEVPVKVTQEVKEEPEPDVDSDTFYEEPPYDEDMNDVFMEEDAYAGFDESGFGYENNSDDDYNDYDDYEESSVMDDIMNEPEEDERSIQLKAQEFDTLSDVSDFCVSTLGVQRPLAVTLVNRALQSNVSPEYRIALAIKLFCKLFDEHKI